MQWKIRSSGQLALKTMATGVDPGYPPSRSSCWSSWVSRVLKYRHMVARWAARDRMLSFSGTRVLPDCRVMMTVWLTSGRVNSCFKEAAAPQKALTPGVTSYSMPRGISSSNCSRTAP